MQQIDEIKKYAKDNYIPIMKDGGIEFICNYIKEHKVKSVLELGTAIGYSASEFALASPDVKITTVEIDIDKCIKAVQNFSDLGLKDRITLINKDAHFLELDEKFDLIFIDAAKAQYIKFFEQFKNNLSENGVIITDNLKFHGMVEDLSLTHNYSTKKLVKKIRKYIEFLKNNTEFSTEFFDCGDGISVSRKNQKIENTADMN